MYTLQKYISRSTKHSCPACGRPGCFVYYVNEANVALAPVVGRCDHQSTCGYHYKPKDFFRDHPSVRIPESWMKPAPVLEKKLYTIYKDEVGRFRSDESVLMKFLLDTFDREAVYIAAAKYQIGALINGSTVFWQIDKEGRVRTGKVMAYGEDGHRIKEEGFDRVNWMHTLLKRDGLLSDSFEVSQCFFGEHLLGVFPDDPVIIVESEKTALICAIKDPSRIYLATGGKYGLTGDRFACLQGRRVTVIPDADAMEEWSEKVEALRQFYDVKIGDPGYTEDDRINKRDIADLILNNLKK